MAVVIGSSTEVYIDNIKICASSVNWSTSVSPQHFYCLNSGGPAFSTYKATQTVSLSVYAGEIPGIYPIEISKLAKVIKIIPSICGSYNSSEFDFPATTEPFVTNSYNYSSEDITSPGQESWSFTRWSTGLQGTSGNTGLVLGDITAQTTSTTDAGIAFFNTPRLVYYTGSVAANSIGKVNKMYYGTPIRFGNGPLRPRAQNTGSVSISLQPLYHNDKGY